MPCNVRTHGTRRVEEVSRAAKKTQSDSNEVRSPFNKISCLFIVGGHLCRRILPDPLLLLILRMHF